MKTIRSNEEFLTFPSLSKKICIGLIWITVLYSVIIQYKYIEINNGMLILGVLTLISFIMAHTGGLLDFRTIFTRESVWLLIFMIYMLPIGALTSPRVSSHIAQWVTSLEYMFLLVVISSLVMSSGTETFHLLLLVTAIALVIIFLKNPVVYPKTDNRYSISTEVNPNALGMFFTTGVWTALYFQQKKKIHILAAMGMTLIFLYATFLTGSRKALIASGIIIILWYTFCYLPRILRGDSKWKPVILILSIMIILLLGMIAVRLYEGSDIEERMGDLGRETTTGSRSSMYRVGWNLFQRSPLFGLGFQGFKYYHGLYSHATLVEVPVSGGFFGTILYFASYFVSLKKCISVLRICGKEQALSVELAEVKMLLVLWAAMLFYCTCIIHPYQFESYVMFGIIFGQSSYLEKKIHPSKVKNQRTKSSRCKWIRK